MTEASASVCLILATALMSAVDQAGDCVTLQPGFQDVCLNRCVLEVASLTH